MDNTFSKGKDIDFDLESGGNTSEDDASRDHDLGKQSSTNIVSRFWSRFLSSDGSSKDACAVESCSSSAKSDDLVDENVELLIDRNLGLEIQEHKTFVKNAYVKLKKKKTNPRKPPKPPRPPKGPSLDAADLKLVREIADLATRKRARVERMKALNKMKTAKASTSSSTGLSAMVITIFFLLVIIFQGISFERHTNAWLTVSPGPAVAASESLISILDYKNSIA